MTEQEKRSAAAKLGWKRRKEKEKAARRSKHPMASFLADAYTFGSISVPRMQDLVPE